MSHRPAPPRPAARRRARRGLALLLVVVQPIGAACGGDRRDEAVEGPPPRPLAEAPASPTRDTGDTPAVAAGTKDDCPMVGLWRRCSVEERLERSGFGLRALPAEVRQPGLAIAGHAYRLGDAELQLFLYADTAAARREAAAVDPDEAEPSDARGILRPPAVIHSANLVALLFNNNDRQKERVELALTAGLPAG
jgi:hypothetical protein